MMVRTSNFYAVFIFIILQTWVTLISLGQPGTVLSHSKISDGSGNFNGVLNDFDYYGSSVATLGDLDGDSIQDVAVGAYGDDQAGQNKGAVWVLFMNSDGTVKSELKITEGLNGFATTLKENDYFGFSVEGLGDLDGDSIPDLAVGAYNDDDGGINKGAVWILFMNQDGTVKGFQKISALQGGFLGNLQEFDKFGYSIANMADIDGDNITDIAVGSYDDDEGGMNRGAVWILFLNNDGTVKSHQKIGHGFGGFTGDLADQDHFGASLESIGDLNNDTIYELAVGSIGDDDGGDSRGAVWILFLKPDGTVNTEKKISDSEGGFKGIIQNIDQFGSSLALAGDIDGDGIQDLIVGAMLTDDGGTNTGALWVLFMNSNGTVHGFFKISSVSGGFTGDLDDLDFFGRSLASFGDLDGDGYTDIICGAFGDDDGGEDRGALWTLFLDESLYGTTKGLAVSCTDSCDGRTNASAIGGLAPYSFYWNDSNSQANDTAFSLCPGTYLVTIVDANADTLVLQQTVNEPSPLNLTIDGTPSTCNLQNGMAVVKVTGGTADFNFTWNDDLFQTNDTAINLSEGVYQVLVEDSRGCEDSMSVNIIDIPYSGAATANVVNNVSCKDGSDGMASVTASGGSAPYIYSWSGSVPQNNDTAVNLIAGTYSVSVTDTNGCSVSSNNVTLTEPLQLFLNTNFSSATEGQNDGSASVAVIGGTSPYSYLWDTNPPQINDTASGLGMGTYMVIITDDHGCIDSAEVTIPEVIGIDDLFIFSRLNIYPNPSVNNLSVYIELNHPAEVKIEIFQVVGKLIYEQSLGYIERQEVDIATEIFNNGIYFLVIDVDGNRVTRKFEVFH